jgi:hypothetical protein
MNQERIEFALKILQWEVDAARSRLRRRKKKLQNEQEVSAHLASMESHFYWFKTDIQRVKNGVKNLQKIEDKDRKSIEWKKGKDMKRHSGRNQMVLAYGRKRSS